MAHSLAKPESEGTVTVIGKSEASWRLRAVVYSVVGPVVLAMVRPHIPWRFERTPVLTAWILWALALLLWLSVMWILCPRLKHSRDGAAIVAFFHLFVVMVFVSEYPCAWEVSCSGKCSRNLRNLTSAFYQYAEEHGGTLPPSSSWIELIMPYLQDPESLHCPKDLNSMNMSYGLNEALSSVSMGDLAEPAETVLLFDCVPATRGVGSGPTDMAARHSGCPNVAFVDGRVMYANPHTQKKLRWKP